MSDFWPKKTGDGKKAMLQVIEDMAQSKKSTRRHRAEGARKMSDDIVFDLYKYNPEEHPPTIVYKAIKEIKSLRQQLAECEKQIVTLRGALGVVVDKPKSHEAVRVATQALTATNDLKEKGK